MKEKGVVENHDNEAHGILRPFRANRRQWRGIKDGREILNTSRNIYIYIVEYSLTWERRIDREEEWEAGERSGGVQRKEGWNGRGWETTGWALTTD